MVKFVSTMKKIWVYIKKYWYLGLIVLGFILSLIFFKNDNYKLADLLLANKKIYDKEINKINEIQNKKEGERRDIEEKYEDKRKEIERQMEGEDKKRKEEQKEKAKELTKKYEKDPKELANELNKTFGIKKGV